jgi:hypothetical protein
MPSSTLVSPTKPASRRSTSNCRSEFHGSRRRQVSRQVQDLKRKDIQSDETQTPRRFFFVWFKGDHEPRRIVHGISFGNPQNPKSDHGRTLHFIFRVKPTEKPRTCTCAAFLNSIHDMTMEFLLTPRKTRVQSKPCGMAGRVRYASRVSNTTRPNIDSTDWTQPIPCNGTHNLGDGCLA